MKEAINLLQTEKYRVIAIPQKTGIYENYLIAFLYHMEVGIIEIVEKNAEDTLTASSL
ncbi:hypothetical protein QMP26_19425 [Enterocloster clostridioformis]